MFDAQILIIAAQQVEQEQSPRPLDSFGMEPFQEVMAECFWDLLILKQNRAYIESGDYPGDEI